MSGSSQDELPTTLHTERLVLRLVDPSNDSDCKEVVRLYNDPHSGQGGHAKVGVKTIADVRQKVKLHGPKAELCTLAPPPRSHCFLVYLPKSSTSEEDNGGTLIGTVGLSFRSEMPFPDLGWALFDPYEGQGYATEAGKEALHFWRDLVGVEKICAITDEDNARSQRCAERVGFVKAGTVDVLFGRPPNESQSKGRGFVLPGMEWKDGMTIRPTVGNEMQQGDVL